MIFTDPERFFRPPYVGHRGWVGVRVDGRPDWALVATLVEQAYRQVAPPCLREAVGGAPGRARGQAARAQDKERMRRRAPPDHAPARRNVCRYRLTDSVWCSASMWRVSSSRSSRRALRSWRS